MARVAINGLGRIGRATLKILMDQPDLQVVAVNDLVDPETLAYLLKYDSVYGRYDRSCRVDNGRIVIGDTTLETFAERDPAQLPWSRLDVDIVFECTGVLRHKGDLEKHLHAGAHRVILSAPAKGDGIPTVVHGVNQLDPGESLRSCASCTTNCIAPVVEIVNRRIGVRKAVMTTIHAYTASQHIVDGPDKDPRRGRAAAINLVPTSTGAALATAKAYPQVEGRFDGVAVRAPVAVGSIADITFVTGKPVSSEDLAGVFREEASNRYQDILGVVSDPMVSSDIIRDSRASVVDLAMTQVIDGDLVKVMSWYDNEWGYSNQMVREARAMARQAQPAGV